MNNRLRRNRDGLRSFALAHLAGCVLNMCFLTGCTDQNTETGPRGADSKQPVASQSSVDGMVEAPAVEASESNEWQSQLAALRAGTSTSIRISKQSVGLPELAELSAVPQFSELTELILDAGVVDDAHMELIAQLPKLEHLRLRSSPLSDVGLEKLSSGKLRSLRILNLPQAKLGPDGLKCLSVFPNLTQLRLGGDWIDDQAVAILATLPELRSLHLIGPRLTEQALEELAKSPKLRSFYLDDCPLADAAWERLFSAQPGLHVHIDQAHHDRDPSSHAH